MHTLWFNNFTSRSLSYIIRPINVKGYLDMLLIIQKNWKQPKCLLIEECLNNLGYINTKKYYGADKKNEAYT